MQRQQQTVYDIDTADYQVHRRTSQGAEGAAAPRLGQNHYFSGKS